MIPENLPPERQAVEQTDYYIVDFDRRTMDREGKINNIFRAERVDHYPIEEMVELKQPRAIAYSPNQPPWFLRANSGTQWEALNQITLRGDVVANQRDRESDRFTLIESEQIQLMMNEDLLTTRRPISFTTEHSSTTSDGADVWLDSGRMVLLKRAASHFDP